MSTNEYSALVARHRKYFRTGATRGVEWRKSQLTALRASAPKISTRRYGRICVADASKRILWM